MRDPQVIGAPAAPGQDGAGLSQRGARTRAAIVTAAHELLREGGYEAMTMRAVADRAGVSLGSAYHYVSSKDELVQEFYEQIQVDHAKAVLDDLGPVRDLSQRLRVVLLGWLEVGRPHHALVRRLVGVAATPGSALSPFSLASRPARERSIALFETVVADSSTRVPDGVRRELPRLLWLAQLGVVLFWAHDDSPDQQRTRELIERIVPLIGRLLRLARVPGFASAAEELGGLIARFGP